MKQHEAPYPLDIRIRSPYAVVLKANPLPQALDIKEEIMTNPVTELLNWIKKQDNEIQAEIAFLMSVQHPNFDFYKFPSEAHEQIQAFCSKIEEFTGHEIGNVGFVVAFRAVFDFTIAAKRGTVEGWSKPQQLMQSVLDSTDPDQPPGMKETAEKMLSKLPARREKWIAVCSSWQELKNSTLSDEAIEKWENDNLLVRGKNVVKPVVIRATPI